MNLYARVSSHAGASTSICSFNCTSICMPRPPSGRRRLSVRAATASSSSPADLITFAEVQAIAARRGIAISLSTLGPGYRVVCRDGGESGPILGVTSGFVVPPARLMHCDALQIFTQGQRGAQGARTRGGILGLGLLIGGATFAFGREAGCSKAEILAINDDDAMHARLVRYYSRFGFRPVVEVTGGRLADLPHMLVWGGAGTRMDADVEEMLGRWTPAIRNSGAGGGGGGGGGGEQAAAGAAPS